jgi:threonine synthase
MDILISSNLERLIYQIAGCDAVKDQELMKSLNENGRYEITDAMRKELDGFYGNYATEEETAAAIRDLYVKAGYVIDPHTAVAAAIYEKYIAETGDHTKTLIASTASPFKFARSVMTAIEGDPGDADEFSLIDRLSEIARVKEPAAVTELRTAPVRHNNVCDKDQMPDMIRSWLGIR